MSVGRLRVKPSPADVGCGQGLLASRPGARVQSLEVESVAAERIDEVAVVEMNESDGRAMFDDVSRDLLSVSGEQFLAAWDRGDYESDERDEVTHVAMLIPFGR
jgi:hypothetical protein